MDLNETPYDTSANRLLLGDDPAAFTVHKRPKGSRFVVVCEHASNHIPASLHGLGLTSDVRNAHIAWDPGALDLAFALSARLEATLIHSNISRLVYDCNRPPGDPTAMPKVSEIHTIPGNQYICAKENEARIREVYLPFKTALGDIITEKKAAGWAPVIVTVHSFTPVYHGKFRKVELGVLHGKDPRLANAMITQCMSTGMVAKLNQPYGPDDGVAHTLDIHGHANDILSVMLELCNDLLANRNLVHKIANHLAPIIEEGAESLSAADRTERD